MRVARGALLGWFLLACSAEPDPLPVEHLVALSPPLHIDQKYRSMAGPAANRDFQLLAGPRQLVWITGYRTEVVDSEGEPGAGLHEFMCHNNLNFDSQGHRASFGLTRKVHFGRMFTASQGQFDIDLPAGFGIPVLSDEPLELNTMVLNHNLEGADLHVRHRITIDFVRDAEARGRLKPLYPTYASVLALVDGPDGVYGVERATELEAGAACHPGEVAPQAPAHARFEGDGLGRIFTPHWVVPPGREERRTLVSRRLNLPFDTTIHFIGVHLHPFAQSVELRDLTTGETVWRATAEAPPQGVGLARVDAFSSTEGIRVWRDHDYEMTSVYDNSSGVDQDAMATFFLYFHDVEMEQALDRVRQALAMRPADDA